MTTYWDGFGELGFAACLLNLRVVPPAALVDARPRCPARPLSHRAGRSYKNPVGTFPVLLDVASRAVFPQAR
jgi:hypothetical protein